MGTLEGRIALVTGGTAGAIDILVNNVWGGYERMMEEGVFTWSKPFWEQPLWRWDAMLDAGVRAHYYASQLAARLMVARGHGLIVNISFWAAQKHIGNVCLWCVQGSDEGVPDSEIENGAKHVLVCLF
jgi:NADP-dependent 3-hydroxy acid dehydrogenase YdfG